MQTGGPRPNDTGRYSEDFDRFRYKKDFGITSNAGGSFKDLSYLIVYKGVTFQLIINSVTTSGADPAPIPRENRQRAKMVLNAEHNTLIIDVDKPRVGETVDLNAWNAFLESHLHYIKRRIDRTDKKRIEPKTDNYRFLDRFDLKQ